MRVVKVVIVAAKVVVVSVVVIVVTALNPYLHVRFKNTATFFSVLDAHMMHKSIAKDCKIICMALFF